MRLRLSLSSISVCLVVLGLRPVMAEPTDPRDLGRGLASDPALRVKDGKATCAPTSSDQECFDALQRHAQELGITSDLPQKLRSWKIAHEILTLDRLQDSHFAGLAANEVAQHEALQKSKSFTDHVAATVTGVETGLWKPEDVLKLFARRQAFREKLSQALGDVPSRIFTLQDAARSVLAGKSCEEDTECSLWLKTSTYGWTEIDFSRTLPTSNAFALERAIREGTLSPTTLGEGWVRLALFHRNSRNYSDAAQVLRSVLSGDLTPRTKLLSLAEQSAAISRLNEQAMRQVLQAQDPTAKKEAIDGEIEMTKTALLQDRAAMGIRSPQELTADETITADQKWRAVTLLRQIRDPEHHWYQKNAEGFDKMMDTFANGALLIVPAGMVSGLLRAGTVATLRSVALRAAGEAFVASRGFAIGSYATGLAIAGAAFKTAESILLTPIYGRAAWNNYLQGVGSSIVMFGSIEAGAAFFNVVGRNIVLAKLLKMEVNPTLSWELKSPNSVFNPELKIELKTPGNALTSLGSFLTEGVSFTAFGRMEQWFSGNKVPPRPLLNEFADNLWMIVQLRIAGKIVEPTVRGMAERSTRSDQHGILNRTTAKPIIRTRLGQLPLEEARGTLAAVGEGRSRIASPKGDVVEKTHKPYIRKNYGPFQIDYDTGLYIRLKYGQRDLNDLEKRNFDRFFADPPQPLMDSFPKVLKVEGTRTESVLTMERVLDFDGNGSRPLSDYGVVENPQFWTTFDQVIQFLVDGDIPLMDLRALNVMVKRVSPTRWVPALVDYKCVSGRMFPFQPATWTHEGAIKKMMRRVNEIRNEHEPVAMRSEGSSASQKTAEDYLDIDLTPEQILALEEAHAIGTAPYTNEDNFRKGRRLREAFDETPTRVLMEENVAGAKSKSPKLTAAETRRAQERAQFAALNRELLDIQVALAKSRAEPPKTRGPPSKLDGRIFFLAKRFDRTLPRLSPERLNQRIQDHVRRYAVILDEIDAAYNAQDWATVQDLNAEAQTVLGQLLDARLARARQHLKDGNLSSAHQLVTGALTAARNLSVEAALGRGREMSDEVRMDLANFRRVVRRQLGVPKRVLFDSVSGKTTISQGGYTKMTTELPGGKKVTESVLVRRDNDYDSLSEAIRSQEHILENQVSEITAVQEWRGLLVLVRTSIVENAGRKGTLTASEASRSARILKPVLAWAARARWSGDRQAVLQQLTPLVGPEGLLRPDAARRDLIAARDLLSNADQSLKSREEDLLRKYDGVKNRLKGKLYSRRSKEVIAEASIRSLAYDAADAQKSGDVFTLLLSLQALHIELKNLPHTPAPGALRMAQLEIQQILGDKSISERLRKTIQLQDALNSVDSAAQGLANFHAALDALQSAFSTTTYEQDKNSISALRSKPIHFSTDAREALAILKQVATRSHSRSIDRTIGEAISTLEPLAEKNGPLGARDRLVTEASPPLAGLPPAPLRESLMNLQDKLSENAKGLLARLAFVRRLPRTVSDAFGVTDKATIEQVVGRNVTPDERKSIEKAHDFGVGPSGHYTPDEIAEKMRILKAAGFNADVRRALLKSGLCGKGSDIPEWLNEKKDKTVDWMKTLYFKSNLTQKQLRQLALLSEDRRLDVVLRYVTIDRLNPLFESTFKRVVMGLGAEVHDAVRSYAILESGKLLRLERFFEEYKYHPGLFEAVGKVSENLRQMDGMSAFARSAFDLADGPLVVYTRTGFVGSIRKPRAEIQKELLAAGIMPESIHTEVIYQAALDDPTLENLRAQLGPAPAFPVQEIQATRPFVVARTKSESEDVKRKSVSPQKIQTVRTSAERLLPRLYSWRSILRLIRRSGNGHTNMESILDSLKDLKSWNSTSDNLQTVEDFIRNRIFELENRIRETIPQPEVFLRHLRESDYEIPVNFEASGIHLGTPKVKPSLTEEPQEPEPAKIFRLTEQARSLTLQTLPDCLTYSSRFEREYRAVPGQKQVTVNSGLLKLAQWFESSGDQWRKALEIGRMETAKREGLWRVRFDKGRGAYRVIFSYTGEGKDRKIRLEAVGHHDDMERRSVIDL